MEERIKEEMCDEKPHQVTELILDNCKSTQISGITDEFSSLAILSINNAGLTCLKGLPALPNLIRLELSDNKLTGGLSSLTGSTALKILNLSGNKIETLNDLEPLKELKKLTHLDLFNCAVTESEKYREKIFELLPWLQYLDGLDKNGEEEPEDLSDEENGTSSKFNGAGESDEDSEDEELDDEDEEEVGLDYLQKSIDEESEEGEDYMPKGPVDDVSEEEGEEEPDSEDSEDEGAAPKTKKRKTSTE